MKIAQKIFIIGMIALMAAVLITGFHFYRVRKTSMLDRIALERIDTSLVELLNRNLEKWDAGIGGGTSELIGKDGLKGHQLNVEIKVLKEYEAECRAEVEKILAENKREKWIIRFESKAADQRAVFNLNIYTVPYQKR